ncbi:hypothetical protein J3458_003759 [Metarhizium acridum]|uniref:uncharacterized protein n=1 Tax=Metarhizium acridum TaxID=92637 RepID=UPI001C6C21AA|nr:hypothetical protein J3458_003759 [Metarhizium acridum]
MLLGAVRTIFVWTPASMVECDSSFTPPQLCPSGSRCLPEMHVFPSGACRQTPNQDLQPGLQECLVHVQKLGYNGATEFSGPSRHSMPTPKTAPHSRCSSHPTFSSHHHILVLPLH